MQIEDLKKAVYTHFQNSEFDAAFDILLKWLKEHKHSSLLRDTDSLRTYFLNQNHEFRIRGAISREAFNIELAKTLSSIGAIFEKIEKNGISTPSLSAVAPKPGKPAAATALIVLLAGVFLFAAWWWAIKTPSNSLQRAESTVKPAEPEAAGRKPAETKLQDAPNLSAKNGSDRTSASPQPKTPPAKGKVGALAIDSRVLEKIHKCGRTGVYILAPVRKDSIIPVGIMKYYQFPGSTPRPDYTDTSKFPYRKAVQDLNAGELLTTTNTKSR